MQVATDIKDKPYAYAVARIQEALLGNSELSVKDSTWEVSVTRGTDTSHRLWISRKGYMYSCLFIPPEYLSKVRDFCEDVVLIQKGLTPGLTWRLSREESKILFAYRGNSCGSFYLSLESPGSKTIIDSLASDLNIFR